MPCKPFVRAKWRDARPLWSVPRVSLPFQIIKTVNESRATREAKKGGVQASLFDVYEGNESHRQGFYTITR